MSLSPLLCCQTCEDEGSGSNEGGSDNDDNIVVQWQQCHHCVVEQARMRVRTRVRVHKDRSKGKDKGKGKDLLSDA